MLETVRAARSEYAGAPMHYEKSGAPPMVDGVAFELDLARPQHPRRDGESVRLAATLARVPVMPSSCQPGFCGTCKVKMRAGRVDHRGCTAAGDDETLACVSRTKGDRLIIDA